MILHFLIRLSILFNYNINIIYDGDSQTFRGYYPNYHTTYVLEDTLVNSLTTHIVGVGGYNTNDVLAHQNFYVLRNFNTLRTNIVILWIGANDAQHGLTDEQILQNLQTYYNNVKSAHGKLILVGINSSTNGYGSRMQEINILFRNNKTNICDEFVDLSLDSRLNNPNDANIYVDGLHYTPIGYQYVAEHVFDTFKIIIP